MRAKHARLKSHTDRHNKRCAACCDVCCEVCRRIPRSVIQLALLAVLLVSSLLPTLAASAQNPTPPTDYTEAAREIAGRMSISQRVGQLFVVSFPGNDVSAESDIADLIANDYIGGVQLSAANRNFSNAADLPAQVAALTNALQSLGTLTRTVPATDTEASAATNDVTSNANFVPLFIATSDDSVGALHSESSRGLTQIPTQLALGATWKPEHAETVGRIVGNELSQIGVNVLLGPNLDVLDTPKPGAPSDPGTRVFGGDPFWVGKFGAAYVNGVHQGGLNRVAVIAKNFPGLGSSDRNIQDEIPTVQKSLEQLKQIELAPFFAVTQKSAYAPSTVEGLLVSHIRYRGFQGNIRASTRPVSLDPQAYQALMSLPELSAWRTTGGVTFSDALGIRSVRRFYDPLERDFNARRIAQEAFVAGNDVLVLGNFSTSDDWSTQLSNIKTTLAFFRTQYQENKAFAARVDEALVRILALKLRLYGGDFALSNVQVDVQLAAQIQPNIEGISAIAKDGISLLAPTVRDLPAVLPLPPGKDDSIVFITDDQQIQECETCAPYPAIAPTALQDIALELYGPKTTGQVDPNRVKSFTFADLAQVATQAFTPTTTTNAIETTPGVADGAASAVEFTATPEPTLAEAISSTVELTATAEVPTDPAEPASEPTEIAGTPTATPSPDEVERAIDQAQWVVIGMLDLNPSISSTATLRNFLSQRADTLRDKRVIILAFSAPYYLDATEISKATAYVGVYSRSQIYLRAAIQALFGNLAYNGDPPVSVNALGYSLVKQTEPEPTQLIPMSAGDALTDTQVTAVPLERRIGDKLTLRAGPIYDRNGQIVPDNTPVQFVLSYPVERVEQPQSAVPTVNGIAETTIVIERKGTIEIRAIAEPALLSYVIRVNISDNDTVSIETIKPTAMPTSTPEPTQAPTVTPRPLPTAQPTLPPQDTAVARTSWTAFAITLVSLFVVGLIGLISSLVTTWNATMRWRAVLISWLAGWAAYVLYALGTPATQQLEATLGWVGLPVVSAVSAVLVLLIFLVGAQRRKQS